MSTSRIRNAMTIGAVAAGILALSASSALAHGDHGEGWVDCIDSSTAVVDGDEPVSSDDEPVCHAIPDLAGGGGYPSGGESDGAGAAAESRRGGGGGDGRAAGCGGAAGGTGDQGASAPDPLRPDSSSADVDTSSASVGGVGAPTFAPLAAGPVRPGSRAAVGGPCPRAQNANGATDEGFVAPTRIDAGAGAVAATSSNAPAVLGTGIMMLGAGVAGVRRRLRQ